jgi:copper resistance protein B
VGLGRRYVFRVDFARYWGVGGTRGLGPTAGFARADHQAVFDRQWVAGLRIWL